MVGPMDGSRVTQAPPPNAVGRDYSAEAQKMATAVRPDTGPRPERDRPDSQPAVADGYEGINQFERGVALLRERRVLLLDQLREVDDTLANISKRAEMACAGALR